MQVESCAKEYENIAPVTIVRPIHNNIFPRHIDYERALLNCFMSQISPWDPDIIVGNNSLCFDMELLLQGVLFFYHVVLLSTKSILSICMLINCN